MDNTMAGRSENDLVNGVPATDTLEQTVNGSNTNLTEQITETEESNLAATDSSPTESKKRKHSPTLEDDRDWRIRRDKDNARGRDRGFRGRARGSHYRGGHGGGRAGGDASGGGGSPNGKWVDYRENIKSDYTRPESRDPDEIRKQVEFYFSDSNLPTDKFLLDKTGGSANMPVPIKVLHSFKRMRHFQPYSAIVEALKDSKVLNVNDSEEVMRKEPLPAELQLDPSKNISLFEDKLRPRSIYAKGFGEEGPNTQFDIEAFFAPYGPTNAIRLRRQHPEKTFKGSVFVEFDSEETAEQFLALESKPKWDGRDLLIMSKEDYVRGKAKEFEQGKITGSSSRGREGGRGRGGRSAWRGRGKDARDGRRHETRQDDDRQGQIPAEELKGHSVQTRNLDAGEGVAANDTAPSTGATTAIEQEDETQSFDTGSKKRTREIDDSDTLNENADATVHGNDVKKVKR